MNRQLLLAAIVATSGLTAFFSAVPDGIRRAEGCSGAGNLVCTAPGWSQAEWAVDPTGVPTDGAVLVSLGASYNCTFTPGAGGVGGAGGSAGGSTVAISVRGPDGSLVPGTPDTVPSPQPATSGAPTTVTWRPTSPFLPSTTYTLRVEGLLGATKATDLTFTTGAGVFASPKPVLVEPSLVAYMGSFTGPSFCCEQQTSCGKSNSCASQTIQPQPQLFGKADVDEPVPAAKALLKAVRQVSVDDGPFVDDYVDLKSAKTSVCARVQATNTITKETAVSKPWCASIAALDLKPSPNCSAMQDVLWKCGVDPKGSSGGSGGAQPGYGLSPSKADALAIYKAVCGTPGTGGTGGSGTGGSGTGGSAGAAAGTGGNAAGSGGSAAGSGGSAGGAGGNAAGAAGDAGNGGTGTGAPPAASAEADDGGGCSVPAGPRPAGASGALGALLGLAALLRSRSRTR